MGGGGGGGPGQLVVYDNAQIFVGTHHLHRLALDGNRLSLRVCWGYSEVYHYYLRFGDVECEKVAVTPLNQLLDAASVGCLVLLHKDSQRCVVGELDQQIGVQVTSAVSCIEGEQCRGQDTSLRCPCVFCSCAGNGLARPHPLCSACKKTEQPFD